LKTEKILVCILALALSVPLMAAEITKRDGTKVLLNNTLYENGKLKGISSETGKELVIERDEISDIGFGDELLPKSSENVASMETSSKELKEMSEKYLALKKSFKPFVEKYSDEVSHTIKEANEYILTSDGKHITVRERIVYINKEEGISSSYNIGFDPNREQIILEYARCIMPDGSISQVKENDIQISRGTSGSTSFGISQSYSFTVPDVTEGCIVHTRYRREEFNPFDSGLFYGRYHFGWAIPTLESVLTVTVPEDIPLYYAFRNKAEDLQKPQISKSDGSISYTWKEENIPGITAEPQMPPYSAVVSAVYFSIKENFDYMNAKLLPMYQERMRITDKVRKAAEELTAGLKTKAEKIAALYLYCQKEIRYISIKGSLAANQVGHSAEHTLTNKYGDCTDKGILLAAMLNAIGIEAYPVIVKTNDYPLSVREVGMFDDNHCITEIHDEGRIFYLDSTATDYRYPYFRGDDHGITARNIIKGTIRTVPVAPPEDNLVKNFIEITLEEDGTARIKERSLYNGQREASMRRYLRRRNPEEYEKAVRNSLAAITADYELISLNNSDPLDFSRPLETSSEYVLKNYAAKSGKYMIFSIPGFESYFSVAGLENRKYDIWSNTTSAYENLIKVILPKGFKAHVPQSLRIRSPYFEGDIIYDLKDGVLEVTKRLSNPVRIVPAKVYPDYRKDLLSFAEASSKKIFFEVDSAVKGDKQ